jgi:hypothetical protein
MLIRTTEECAGVAIIIHVNQTYTSISDGKEQNNTEVEAQAGSPKTRKTYNITFL